MNNMLMRSGGIHVWVNIYNVPRICKKKLEYEICTRGLCIDRVMRHVYAKIKQHTFLMDIHTHTS